MKIKLVDDKSCQKLCYYNKCVVWGYAMYVTCYCTIEIYLADHIISGKSKYKRII